MKKVLIAMLGLLVCIALFGEPRSARTDKFSTMSETWYETKFEERKIVEYKLVCCGTEYLLSDEVNEYLKKGWHLYGSVAIYNHYFAQAVVRYE